jgi:hypothetical protein
MARETCPAMLMITSSPAPDSASSVTNVWRASCHRPLSAAFSRTFFQAVLNDVIGRVGSFGRGEPKANTNHSPLHSPNRRMYQAACASSAASAVVLSGITRPVPASLFDRPTVRTFLWTRSICSQRISRNSLSRRPVFKGQNFGMGSVMRYKELGPISHDQLQRFLAEGVASHHPFTLMDHAHFRSDFLSTSDGPRS